MKFVEFLKDNNNGLIFVDPCSGNNGDLLIWLGMQEALKKAGVEATSDATKAELIVVNGSGNFIDAYRQGIGKIKTYTKLHPNTPLCIAPSSYHFQTVDFGSLLDERICPVYLFSRERYSKTYIDKLAESRRHVYSYIDHDLAFHLENSERLSQLQTDYPHAKAGNVLVVDRMDVENSATGRRLKYLRHIYALVPQGLKAQLRRLRVSRRNTAGSHFTHRATKLIGDTYTDYVIDALETKDISRNDLCDFNEFVRKVAEADFIFTNRLHVGILAYLLRRTVYLDEGSYYKMQGIYEYSMAHGDHVHLMPRD